MSTDFNAFFNVGIVRSPQEWVQSFATAGPHVDALIAKWRERWRVSAWSLEDPASTVHGPLVARIYGPGGFGIHVLGKAAELYHCSPWKLFLYDAEHQFMVRAACYELARVLKSEIATYAPELSGAWAETGQDLGAVLTQLESHWGPPAASLADLATNSESAPGWQYRGCHYVDDFMDIVDRLENGPRHGS